MLELQRADRIPEFYIQGSQNNNQNFITIIIRRFSFAICENNDINIEHITKTMGVLSDKAVVVV